MKNFKLIVLLLLILLFFSLLLFLKPIKNNFIYNKEVTFSDNEFSDKKYEINDDKILKKAKEYLNNLFGDNFSKNNYNSSVSFNNYSNHTIATVLFLKDKPDKDISYAIGFDIYSGEVLNIYNNKKNNNISAPLIDKTLSEDELKKLAIDAISKINNCSENDFVFKSYFEDNIYGFVGNLKKSNKEFNIELDSLTGTILLYIIS